MMRMETPTETDGTVEQVIRMIAAGRHLSRRKPLKQPTW
jgi:hypothetical protein